MFNHIKIKIVGKNPNYFLKELFSHQISIYQLQKDNNSLEIVITARDYQRLKAMKTSYKILVLKRYGINYYQYLLKNYWYLFLFISIGLLLNVFLSQLVLEIEIVHPNHELQKIIEKDLEEFGLKRYTFKMNDSQKREVKEKLYQKEKDRLEWLEIEEEGTKYKILLEERKKNSSSVDCYPRDIIAKKNAIILEIEASSGEIMKKREDYVVKGETIISGFIHNKDKVVSKKCAIGKVYGETWYKVVVSLPKEEIKEVLCSEKQKGIFIQYFQKIISSKNNFSTFQKNEYNIIEGGVIPLKMGFVEYQKTKKIHRIYSFSELEEMALSLAEKKLQGGKTILLKKVLKKSEKNSRIEVEVFLKVKEDITDYMDISDIPVEEE